MAATAELAEQFHRAVTWLDVHPAVKVSQDQKLKLYGFYKQVRSIFL